MTTTQTCISKESQPKVKYIIYYILGIDKVFGSLTPCTGSHVRDPLEGIKEGSGGSDGCLELGMKLCRLNNQVFPVSMAGLHVMNDELE